MKRLTSAKPVAAHTGTVTLMRASCPPRKGPTMNPSPKATPMSPKARALCSGGVMSAKTALAVAAVPPLTPSINRARNSSIKGREAPAGQSRLTVRANRPRPSTDPLTHVAITGRRPKRSLRAPIRGSRRTGRGHSSCQQSKGAPVGIEARQQEGQQRKHDAFAQPVVQGVRMRSAGWGSGDAAIWLLFTGDSHSHRPRRWLCDPFVPRMPLCFERSLRTLLRARPRPVHTRSNQSLDVSGLASWSAGSFVSRR